MSLMPQLKKSVNDKSSVHEFSKLEYLNIADVLCFIITLNNVKRK